MQELLTFFIISIAIVLLLYKIMKNTKLFKEDDTRNICSGCNKSCNDCD